MGATDASSVPARDVVGREPTLAARNGLLGGRFRRRWSLPPSGRRLEPAVDIIAADAGDVHDLSPRRTAGHDPYVVSGRVEQRREERDELRVRTSALGGRRDPHLPCIAVPPDELTLRRAGRDDDREPGHHGRRRYHRPMADRAAVERDLEEIGTQLAWVRDYL
jgi:hypothetical protein